MRCSFCATGTMGLSGNLSTGEILEQIVHADQWLAHDYQEQNEQNEQKENVAAAATNDLKKKKKNNEKSSFVRNVVFMGMGEPLDTYVNVAAACHALLDRHRWNLASEHVTVSTIGIPSRLRQLTRELPCVSVALSLHAPTQELRERIVPVAKQYPLEDLMQALEEHVVAVGVEQKKKQRQLVRDKQKLYSVDSLLPKEDEHVREKTRRRAMIEYVMLQGPTSTRQAAHDLGRLCQHRSLVINLIPYNSTNVEDKFSCPSWPDMEEFQRIVQSYGLFCTIRRTMGADIASACGQLLQQQQQQSNQTREATTVVTDVEDIVQDATNRSRTRMNKQLVKNKYANKRVVDAAVNTANTERGEDDSANDSNDESLLTERWIRPLTIATSVAATCFVLSSIFFFTSHKQMCSKR